MAEAPAALPPQTDLMQAVQNRSDTRFQSKTHVLCAIGTVQDRDRFGGHVTQNRWHLGPVRYEEVFAACRQQRCCNPLRSQTISIGLYGSTGDRQPGKRIKRAPVASKSLGVDLQP